MNTWDDVASPDCLLNLMKNGLLLIPMKKHSAVTMMVRMMQSNAP